MSEHVRTLIRTAAVVATFAATAAMPVAAQQENPRPVLAVTAGASQYDLSGTGTDAFVGVRAQLPMGRYMIVEPAVSYFTYPNQVTGTPWRIVLPEVQVQAQFPLGGVRPYLGAGAGMSWERLQDEQWTELTLSVAAGLRIDLPAGFMVGGELRVRALDPWTGSMADWGLSIGRRL